MNAQELLDFLLRLQEDNENLSDIDVLVESESGEIYNSGYIYNYYGSIVLS